MVASKEAHEAAASAHRLESAKLREESEGLTAQAEQVDVLMARCARLEVSCNLSTRCGQGVVMLLCLSYIVAKRVEV